MNAFKKEVEPAIVRAIRDLFSDKDKFHCVDVEVVADTVASFVLKHENFDTINEMNQYETYYKILGKAVAITQGWKINRAADIQLPSQTKENLEKYMTDTYGAKAMNGTDNVTQ